MASLFSATPPAVYLEALCGPETAAGLPMPSAAFHFSSCVYVLLGVAAADFFSRALFPDSSLRWFWLHALANGVVVAFSLRDVGAWAAAPLCSMVLPHSSWMPSHIAMSLHVWHLLAFTSLRMDDIVHHVLFVGVFSLLNFVFAWGRVVNVLLFFITGLPGGSTYAMLVGVKLGGLNTLREKAISAALNTWVRAPGIIAFATTLCACAAHGLCVAPRAAVLVCAALASTNALYYGAQAKENFVQRRDAAQLKAAPPAQRSVSPLEDPQNQKRRDRDPSNVARGGC